MLCPFCREKDTSVLTHVQQKMELQFVVEDIVLVTGMRFTTFERVQIRELTVIKKNGRRAPFDREKLAKSFTALKKGHRSRYN